MDEAKIAAQVAQNIPKPVDDPATVVAAIVQDEDIVHSPVDADNPELTARFSDYFGVDSLNRHTDKNKIQIRAIVEWANQMSGSDQLDDMLVMVQRLERELGVDWRPNRVALVYKFIQIQRESSKLQNDLELVRGGFARA